MFTRAIVRPPGDSYALGLTRVELGAPSPALARAQHARYCEALRDCGLAVEMLPEDPAFPDSTFVEDTAVLHRGGAMLTRPGAPSRAGEVAAIATALVRHYTELARIEAPATLDGGDICDAGTHVFIGVSARTSEAGAAQLAAWLQAQGSSSSIVDIRAMRSILHLKSGIACLDDGRLLLIEELATHPAFEGRERIVLAPDETYGANAVQVNARVLVSQGHPKLEADLRAHGHAPLALDMSEFAKMDGGLSCLSLRF